MNKSITQDNQNDKRFQLLLEDFLQDFMFHPH